MYICHDGCVDEKALNSHQGYFPTIMPCIYTSCLGPCRWRCSPFSETVCRDDAYLSKEGWEVLYHSPQVWDVGLTISLRSSYLAESRKPSSAARGLQEPGEERAQGLGAAAFPNLGALGSKLVSKTLYGTRGAKPFIAWIFKLLFSSVAIQTLSITKIQ